MEYICGLCGERISRDLLVYIDHTEKHIMQEIQAKHPEWSEKDGLCTKCLEYYHKQLKGESS
jgi:hypothetical protein